MPTPVPPKKGGGGGAKPSVLRHAKIASATVWPHPIPLAIAALLSRAPIDVSETARRASSVLF
jgi:hypothetical protein